MKRAPEKQTSPVYRITVDERLTNDLMRILIAGLKPDRITFNDDRGHWDEEEEFMVGPDDYQRTMGLTPASVKQWPWKNMLEGQVFLRGRFQDSRGRPGEFVVDTKMKQTNFQRIDYFSKNRVKNIYLSALERSNSNGETNRTR